jgi:hypothetical protein
VKCRVVPDATAFELREAGGVHLWIESDWSDPQTAESSRS